MQLNVPAAVSGTSLQPRDLSLSINAAGSDLQIPQAALPLAARLAAVRPVSAAGHRGAAAAGYRSCYPASLRWQFTGLRSACDAVCDAV